MNKEEKEFAKKAADLIIKEYGDVLKRLSKT